MSRDLVYEDTPRELTDISRGIIAGRRVSPGQLRRMAENADVEAASQEDAAARTRHRADLYRDVADARERGEI